jgi:hypothetical protein
MSVVADLEGTGASLGEYDRLWTYIDRDRHTASNVNRLASPGLMQALDKFDTSITEPLLPLLYFGGVETFEVPELVYIDDLSDDLGDRAVAGDLPEQSAAALGRPDGNGAFEAIVSGLSRNRHDFFDVAAEAAGEAPPTAEERAVTVAGQSALRLSDLANTHSAEMWLSTIRLVAAHGVRDPGRISLAVAPIFVNALPALNLGGPGELAKLTEPLAAQVRVIAQDAARSIELWNAALAPLQADLASLRESISVLISSAIGSNNLTLDFIRRLTRADVEHGQLGDPAANASDDTELAARADKITTAAARLSGSGQVLDVISDCAKILNLPPVKVAAAAGIKRSTFFNWQSSPDTRPQLAKVETLWRLAQAVMSVDAVSKGSTARLIHSEPDRRERLIRGEFEDVIEEIRQAYLDADVSPGALAAKEERQRISGPSYTASDTREDEEASASVRFQRGTGRPARRARPAQRPDAKGET